VLLGNNTLTLTQAQSTFSGQITGTGGLTVAGGDQTLSGSNSYAGPTTIQAGASLNLTGGGAISSSAVQSDGLFDIRYTAGDVAIAGLTGAGQINLGIHTLTLTQAQGTFGGQITGTGGLTVAGGSQTLSGSNDYSGQTLITAGASLALSGAGSLAHSSGVRADGTWDISGTADDAATAGLTGAGQVSLGARMLTLTQAQGTFSGQITGTGGLTVAGGDQTLSGANDYSGQTLIAAGASLALSGAGSLAHSSGVRADGTWDISGTAGDAAIAGLTGSGQVSLGARTLTLTQAQGTFSGQITGTGGLTVAGGTQTLSGSNSYTGNTTIHSGTLIAAHSNAVGSGAVRIEGGVFSVESGVQITNAIMLSGGGYQRAISGNLTSAVNATSLLGGVDTTAQILGGSSGSTTLITSFSDASDALNDGIRRSDVYSFQGTGTSVFVLELSFASLEPGTFLAWLNGENQWVNAVEGNLSGTNNAGAAQRGFAGSFSLFQNGDGGSFAGYGANLEDYIGAWGVEMSGGATGVWAVLNHNSDFAAVPEPAPCLPVALACLTLPLLCRKRRHTA